MIKRAAYAVAIAAIAVMVFLILQRPSAEKKVASLLQHQTTLFEQGDVKAAYATLSQDAHTRCSYTSFATAFAGAKKDLAQYSNGSPTLSNIHVQVQGVTAKVEADIYLGPFKLFSFTAEDPLTYVETGGSWYLDSAGSADQACSAS